MIVPGLPVPLTSPPHLVLSLRPSLSQVAEFETDAKEAPPQQRCSSVCHTHAGGLDRLTAETQDCSCRLLSNLCCPKRGLTPECGVQGAPLGRRKAAQVADKFTAVLLQHPLKVRIPSCSRLPPPVLRPLKWREVGWNTGRGGDRKRKMPPASPAAKHLERWDRTSPPTRARSWRGYLAAPRHLCPSSAPSPSAVTSRAAAGRLQVLLFQERSFGGNFPALQGKLPRTPGGREVAESWARWRREPGQLRVGCSPWPWPLRVRPGWGCGTASAPAPARAPARPGSSAPPLFLSLAPAARPAFSRSAFVALSSPFLWLSGLASAGYSPSLLAPRPRAQVPPHAQSRKWLPSQFFPNSPSPLPCPGVFS